VRSLLPALLALLAAPALAQPGEIVLGSGPRVPEVVVAWNASAVAVAGRPRSFRLQLTGQIVDGWRVYAMGPSVAGRPLEVTLTDLPAGFSVARAPREAAPTLRGRDIVLNAEYPYFAGRAAVVAELRAGPRVRPGRHVVRGTVRYSACDDRICLAPRTVPFEANLVVAGR
jgi:DsbC/DsbD-like thiol-disulfide interchange protein